MESDEKIDHACTELYNKAQVCLIRYMLLKGIIQEPEDYVRKGYAEAFDLLSSGSLSVPHKVDWDSIRKKVRSIADKIRTIV